MKKNQIIDKVSIEYKNDKKANERFIKFIMDYLLETPPSREDDFNDRKPN